MDHDLVQRIRQTGVIAVLVIDDARHAVPLARSLVAGGIDVMELTLRTPAALDALRAIRREVPEMLAGMGTVLSPEQVVECHAAGAAFAVAPGTSPRVVNRAREVGLPFAPGVATPSDIEAALELGCRALKFFPAEPSGGLGFLRSIAAPYAHLGIGYIPLGGIDARNVRPYLESPLVLAVGGSWIAPRERVREEDWAGIEATAREAREAADVSRGKA